MGYLSDKRRKLKEKLNKATGGLVNKVDEVVVKPVDKHVAKPIGKAAKNLEDSVEKDIKQNIEGAKEIGRDINRAANDLEDGVENVFREYKEATEEMIDWYADTIEVAVDYAKEHPFETALILGGGFATYAVIADLGAISFSIIAAGGATATVLVVTNEDDEEEDEAIEGADPRNLPRVKKRFVKKEDEFNDSISPGVYVHSNGVGVPMPNIELAMPTQTGEIRTDGQGDMMSIRWSGQYVRRHAGFDFSAKPGEQIVATLTGDIVGWSYPYGKDAKMPNGDPVRGLEIVSENGYSSIVWYVNPSNEIAEALDAKRTYSVKAGVDVIGGAQDIAGYYKSRKSSSTVPPHVHALWKDPQGRFINPDGSLFFEDNKPKKSQ